MATGSSTTAIHPSAETSASVPNLSVSHNTHHHHHRHRKGSDPFLDLADSDLKLPDPSSPSSKQDENGESQSDSLLADLVLTPLNMISFIVSLFMIDQQHSQWRLSQHASRTDTFWFRLTHWSWLNPEPYQDSQDGTWKHKPSASAPTGQGSLENTYQGWYTRKKHRAVAKMEMSDAFEMRKRVVAAIVAWTLLGLLGITYAIKQMFGWLFKA